MTDNNTNIPQDDPEDVPGDDDARRRKSSQSDPLESTVDSIGEILDETKPDRAATSIPDEQPSAKVPELFDKPQDTDSVVKPFGIDVPATPRNANDTTQETIDQTEIDETYQLTSENALEDTSDTIDLEEAISNASDQTVVIAGTGKGSRGRISSAKSTPWQSEREHQSPSKTRNTHTWQPLSSTVQRHSPLKTSVWEQLQRSSLACRARWTRVKVL